MQVVNWKSFVHSVAISLYEKVCVLENFRVVLFNINNQRLFFLNGMIERNSIKKALEIFLKALSIF